MNTKEMYKRKIEAELELLQANLDTLKTKAKIATTDIQITYSKEIEILEKDYNIAKAKLAELNKLGVGVWNHLKEDIGNTWDTFSSYAKKTPDNISEIKKDIK
jgi:hypothetical protein